MAQGGASLAGMRLPRRHLLRGLVAGAVAMPGLAWADTILIVSRDRLLRDSASARELREAEETMNRQLQISVDEATAQLAAEEAELTKLRAEIAPAAFDERAADFDRRIRAVRREAQERSAFLQRGFKEARATLVAAIPALLEKVRVEKGADVILNADNVLAAAAGADVTDEVIELMNAEGPRPPSPKIDLASPLMAPPGEISNGAQPKAE